MGGIRRLPGTSKGQPLLQLATVDRIGSGPIPSVLRPGDREDEPPNVHVQLRLLE